MKPAAITFDFHNTLVECDQWFQLEIRGLVSSVLAWAGEHGHTTADQRAKDRADREYRKLRVAIHEHGHEIPSERAVTAVLDRIGQPLPAGIVDAAVDDLMRRALESAQPIPGAVTTVHDLAAAGTPLGVVSSAVHHPFLEWALARFDMIEAFGTVTTSASVGFYKSRPEIYWMTLDRLHADPAASVHVGDSLRFDVGGAARAGMKTAWLRRPASHVENGFAPDLVLDTLEGSASSLIDLARFRG